MQEVTIAFEYENYRFINPLKFNYPFHGVFSSIPS